MPVIFRPQHSPLDKSAALRVKTRVRDDRPFRLGLWAGAKEALDQQTTTNYCFSLLIVGVCDTCFPELQRLHKTGIPVGFWPICSELASLG